MRPARIEMKGFGAFRETTEIEFGDLDLVAVVGPTGSGKSTVIDAITFALYGSIARYDDERLVAPAIHQLSNEAKVRFDFLLDQDSFTVVRVMRKTAGGATTKEARLERNGEVVSSGARELTPAVEELLGLDFPQFTKTIVLPQGDFAEFLHDKPADRQKLLRQLLDLGVYSRMGQFARQRAGRARERAEFLEEQIRNAGDLSEDHLTELKERKRLLDETLEELGKAIADLSTAQESLKEQREFCERLERQIASLAKVNIPDGVEGLDEQLTSARKEVEKAELNAKTAREKREVTKQAVREGPNPAKVEAGIRAREQREKLDGEISDLAGEVKELAEKAEGASAALEKAQRAYDEAHQRAERLRLESTAAQWVAELRVGEPCPVCRQTVAEIPHHDPKSELVAAKEQETRAKSALEEAGIAERKATDAHSKSEARLAALRDQRGTLDQELRESPEIEELLAQRKETAELAEALEKADEAVEAADQKASQARSQAEKALTKEQAARRRFTEARDAVAELEPPAPEGDRLLDDWQSLVQWAAKQHDVLLGGLGEANKGRDELRAKVEGLEERAREIFEPLALDETQAVPSEDMIPRLKEERGRVASDIDAMKKRLEQLSEWRTDLKSTKKRGEVAHELGGLLRAEGFERWLLAEALEELVSRATERLLELSGEQYSLVVEDSQFRIRDHRNADELRDARTLSGGETFLTSLSLALALSERVSDLAGEGSVKLGSMFLDEGFGTLDPETLDVVASALEELGASGRMVCVVTHIRDLADRLPVRLEVRKGPTTSTVSLVER